MPNASAVWMPLYCRDLLVDDAWLRLSPAQRGIFTALLCHQWIKKGTGLPADTFDCFLLSGAPGWIDEKDSEWQTFPLDALFPVDKKDQRRRNARCHSEWLTRVDRHTALSEAGKRGVEEREKRRQMGIK